MSLLLPNDFLLPIPWYRKRRPLFTGIEWVGEIYVDLVQDSLSKLLSPVLQDEPMLICLPCFCQCQRARENNRSDVLIPWWQSNAPSSKIIMLVWKVPFCISTSPGLTWPERILKAAPLLVLATAYWVLNLIFKYLKSMKNGRKRRSCVMFVSPDYQQCAVHSQFQGAFHYLSFSL